MKLETKPHSKWLTLPTFVTLDVDPPFGKGSLGGIEIVQHPQPVKSVEEFSASLNALSIINMRRRTLVSLQCILLSAVLMSFMSTTHAQAAPPTETYKPDPIATTSQALQGKLFFNDAERAKAEKDRKDIASGKVVIEGVSAERSPVLNGFVKRSDGATTYWVGADGEGDTRFVAGENKKGTKEIVTTSTMVGGEPKFVLTGTVVGEKSADVKVEKKMPEKAKSKKRKKTTIEKKKNSRPNAKRASK